MKGNRNKMRTKKKFGTKTERAEDRIDNECVARTKKLKYLQPQTPSASKTKGMNKGRQAVNLVLIRGGVRPGAAFTNTPRSHNHFPTQSTETEIQKNTVEV